MRRRATDAHRSLLISSLFRRVSPRILSRRDRPRRGRHLRPLRSTRPAQRPSSSISGSIPQGKPTSEPLMLTIRDAIARGLKYNLALVETDESVQVRRAERLRALSTLLPTAECAAFHLRAADESGGLRLLRISRPPDHRRPVHHLRCARLGHTVAAQFSESSQPASGPRIGEGSGVFLRDIREEVVLAVTGLYLQAVAGTGAYRSAAGTGGNGRYCPSSGRRPQVRRYNRRHRCAARASGTAIRAAATCITTKASSTNRSSIWRGRSGYLRGQSIELEPMPPYAPLPGGMTLESALDLAYSQRADYRAAESRVRAAELAKGAAQAGRLPTADLNANYG